MSAPVSRSCARCGKALGQIAASGPAAEIRAFCLELNEDRPRVIIHPGWMLARYRDSFHASRLIHILNALMGSIEQPGGLFYPKGAKDAGKKGLKSLTAIIPPVTEERADGCGTRYPQWDKGAGMLQTAYEAIDTGIPQTAIAKRTADPVPKNAA